ncbi:MAG: translation initiation factor IF-2 N-terminal domain-containing protein, partial [Candidatus Sericytochromatia bacterium]
MAKELNVSSKDLVTLFNDMGVPVKNHLAWVEGNEAEAAKKRLLAPKEEPAAEAEKPAAQPAAQGAPAGRAPERPLPPRPTPSNVSVPPRRPDQPPTVRRPEGAPAGRPASDRP